MDRRNREKERERDMGMSDPSRMESRRIEDAIAEGADW